MKQASTEVLLHHWPGSRASVYGVAGQGPERRGEGLPSPPRVCPQAVEGWASPWLCGRTQSEPENSRNPPQSQPHTCPARPGGLSARGPREHRRPFPGQPPTQGSVPKAWQLPLVLILGPEMYHKVTCCCLGKLQWHGACSPLSEHGAQSTEGT